MQTTHYQSCMEACQACAVACDTCIAGCLHEQDVKMMAACIKLDLDCSKICTLAVGFMATNSPYAQQVCELCAIICEACAAECAKHHNDHCQACAAACKKCAEACRSMKQAA